MRKHQIIETKWWEKKVDEIIRKSFSMLIDLMRFNEENAKKGWSVESVRKSQRMNTNLFLEVEKLKDFIRVLEEEDKGYPEPASWKYEKIYGSKFDGTTFAGLRISASKK